MRYGRLVVTMDLSCLASLLLLKTAPQYKAAEEPAGFPLFICVCYHPGVLRLPLGTQIDIKQRKKIFVLAFLLIAALSHSMGL